MPISVEYAVEEAMDLLQTDHVLMTITNQEPGELRNRDSFPGRGMGNLSTRKRPDRLHGPLSRLSKGTGRSLSCIKRLGCDAVVYCPV